MSASGPASLLSQAKEQLRAKDAPADQWKQLCSFLSGLKGQEQASLLKPLEAALATFPSAVRTVWPQWLVQQRQGQRVPALQLARSLSWTGPRLDAASLRELLSHPDFPQLRRLKLFGQDLDTQALRLLIHAPRLRQLQSLNLTSNRVDGAGLRALAAADSKLKLQQLFLGRNKIEDADTDWLLVEPVCNTLDLLCLRENPLTAGRRDELEAFFETSPLELRLAVAGSRTSIPKRKRGRPSKKTPPRS